MLVATMQGVALTDNTTIFENEQDFVEQYRESCLTRYGTPFEELADHDRFYALAELIANKGRATT